MARIRFTYLLMLVALASTACAQSCFKIRGRAVDYRGDGFFAIWRIGTHHLFWVNDNKSVDLVCKYFDCESGDRQPALFADFTVCPTEGFVEGSAQGTAVIAVERPRVISDWPAESSPEAFLKDFLAWYVPRGRNRELGEKWEHVLELMRWDLSPQLTKLLGIDAPPSGPCKLGVEVGFDPILGSTMPGDSYEVGTVKRVGASYKAEIFEVTSTGRKDVPEVIAEFVRKDEAWTFVNFVYPGRKFDLLSLLKATKHDCY